MPELRVRNCYLKPHLFATQCAEWAAAAREFVRQRPDLCSLQFSSAHVCGPASNFESVSVPQQSAESVSACELPGFGRLARGPVGVTFHTP